MEARETDKTAMPGGHVVCEALLREGVDVVFGLPGGAILPLYDSLWHYPQIRHILMRHEQGSAHAAEAYARVTGKPGVCLATSGPGATNLITGLAAAKLDSTPVVAITGQVARNFMGTEAFQECDTIGMSRPLLKKTYQVLNPKDIAATIQEAFHAAREGRPGPVLVDIPKDVQAEMTHYSPSPMIQDQPSGQTRPATEVLEAAASMLNEAERPLFIVGHGVHLSKAWPQLRAVAEAANVPVVNTIHGTGAFPRRHPLALGMLGMHGMYWSNMATAEADLVVGIGMRFDDRVTGKPGTFAPNARIIHMEIEPRQVSKNVRADLALIGDAKIVLADLLPLVQSKPRYVWHNRLAELQRDHPSIDVPDVPSLTPQFVLRELNKVIESSTDPIVTTGVGQHQMWAAQFLFLDNPRSFVTSGGLGVMGFEVPAAIGAKVGRPESDVWSVAGDGGFQMTLQELATVVQEDLPVKYVILNNQHLGMVRQWQELFYDERYKAVPVSNPDYVKLAEAYGIPSASIGDKSEVADALATAAAYNGPFVLEFRVSPDENVYPMVPPGATLSATVEDPRVVNARTEITPAPEGTVSYP